MWFYVSQVMYEMPTWFPAPRTMPLADAESQSSEKAAAWPDFRLVSYSSWMSPEIQQDRQSPVIDSLPENMFYCQFSQHVWS